jgi:dihydrodipicolinate reductase
MVNVGLIGLGRIGKVIAKSILEHPGLNLVLVVHRTGSKDKYVGQDLGDVLNIRKTGIEIKGSRSGTAISLDNITIYPYGSLS